MDALSNVYLNFLPMEFIRSMAGFGKQPGSYFLARAVRNPPESLQKKVFPWLDQFDGLFGPREHEGQQKDLAGAGFVALLKYLRLVLLQDSVLMKERYPQHQMWSEPLFKTSEYRAFAADVKHEILTRPDQPIDTAIQQVIPAVAIHLSQTHQEVINNGYLIKDLHQHQADEADRRERRHAAELIQQVSLQMAAFQQTVASAMAIINRPRSNESMLPPGQLRLPVFDPAPAAAAAISTNADMAEQQQVMDLDDITDWTVEDLHMPLRSRSPLQVDPYEEAQRTAAEEVIDYNRQRSTPSSVPVPAPAPAPAQAPPPEEFEFTKMRSDVATVHDLWAEWHDGEPAHGRPSVVWMDRQYGTRWRRVLASTSQFYSQRRAIIKEVERRKDQTCGGSVNLAIQQLDDLVCRERMPSLNKLAHLIKKGKIGSTEGVG